MATSCCDYSGVSDLEQVLQDLSEAQREGGSGGVASVTIDGNSVQFDREQLNAEIAHVRKLLARKKGCRPLFRRMDMSS